MANKGGTAETSVFVLHYKDESAFLSSFSKCFGSESEATATNVLVAKAKRQLQMFW
ncbi:hypothetical protein FJQ98_17285 [Lysinibacillus agricola]|uniref:Uncharacterized protein n=1 Tax=Lysinibacillus agricola TaxID=2590012 RepID=A0ABX7AMJ6_9BACI|nr:MULTISPECIES: hypothetical protein [Lysinibacillus]QQP10986.1 hypothetical protein FJQ98_17285 [Lysinibacillus agricola]